MSQFFTSGGQSIRVSTSASNEYSRLISFTDLLTLVRKFGKLGSGHRTGKGRFSFQSQRKAMPKNAQTIPQVHLSHMLKILQARLQQYMNHELPDVQAGFRKGRGTRDQIANICWIIKKARGFQKNIYFCFVDCAKALCGSEQTVENYERDGNTRPPDLPPENLYAGQEATVRTGHGTTDWFQIGQGVHQGCILSPCLFNLNAKYIMRNVGLDESQAGIKTAREKYQQPQICR